MLFVNMFSGSRPMICSYYYFFFFYCSGAHRDLHSFPTRRSSDLPAARDRRAAPPPHGLRGRADLHGGRRSEEHTSELQSRFDLVCRLLLEKKKKVQFRLRVVLASDWFR